MSARIWITASFVNLTVFAVRLLKVLFVLGASYNWQCCRKRGYRITLDDLYFDFMQNNQTNTINNLR